MNNDFDRIRDIQAKLAKLPCPSCPQQRLALVLRYNGHKGRWLFIAFCKSCRMEYAVDPDTVHFLDDQGPHANSLQRNLGHGGAPLGVQ